MLTTDQFRDMTPEQLGAKLSELATGILWHREVRAAPGS